MKEPGGRMLREDQSYCVSAAPVLQEFILSTELFWNLTVPPGESLPGGIAQLSIGQLLLSRKRVDAQLPNLETDCLYRQIDEDLRSWRSAVQRKAGAEIPMRLRLWKGALDDLQEEGRINLGYEIRHRTILALLLETQKQVDPMLLTQVGALDERFRGLTAEGEFIWEAGFQPGFSESNFWFLYRHIR